MKTNDILNELKQERASQKLIWDAADQEIKRLEAAIDALNGPTTGSARAGPSVRDMVEQCAREFVRKHQADGLTVTVSNRNVFDEAALLFPDHVRKIKQGIANALKTMLVRNKIRLCPGGFHFT